VPNNALETGAPRPAGESEKNSRSAIVTPAMTSVEAEQYSGEACDNDDSEMRRAAHEFLLGYRAGAHVRLLGTHKTS